MSKTPNYDAKIQSILAATKPGERVCKYTGNTWLLEQDEIDACRKMNVPPMQADPNIRWAIFGYFSTGFQFWWNKHFDTGEPVLSFIHPASGLKVLPDKEWHDRDFSLTYADYDPNRPILEQLRALQLRIPYPATHDIVPPENSIAIVSAGDKNSYFVIGCRSINTFISTVALDTENSSLIFTANNIVDSHHVMMCDRMFRCKYVTNCRDCIDSAFLFDCRNCKNCFGASNKRNKEYIFFNEQLGREEYQKRVSEIDLGKRSVVKDWQRRFDALLKNETVWPENFNEGCADSTGEYLTNAVRCKRCFTAFGGAVDNIQTAYSWGSTDSNSSCWAPKDASDCHACCTCAGSHLCKYSYRSYSCDDCEYSINLMNCMHCFGCVGLNRKEYCIFNKQYGEEEYWLLVDQIKCRMLEDGEYGEYLPTIFSGTYIPESGPVIYSGATIGQLEQIGGNWFDPNAEGATGFEKIDQSKMKQAKDVPDSIDDLTDDWIGVPIFDEASKRTFTFIKPELEHYRKLRIAPPNNHFIHRMVDVSTKAQLCALETRKCSKCGKTILTSRNDAYPDRKIYCSEHYLKYLEETT